MLVARMLGFGALKTVVKSVKKLAEKFGGLKIKRTFALPFEKRVSDKGREFLRRLTPRKKSENFFTKNLEIKK